MTYSRTRTHENEKSGHRRRVRYLMMLNLLFIGLIGAVAALWYVADSYRGDAAGPNAAPSTAHAASTPATSAATSPSLSSSPLPGASPDAAPTELPEPDPEPDDSPAPDPAEPDADAITLAIVGDVLPASGVVRLMEKHGYDYPYRESLHLLQSADIAAGNLETAITDRGTPEEDKEYVYRGPVQTLPALRDAGFDVWSLANNHTLDYGWVGLQDTMAALDEHGFARVGAGHDDAEAYAPAYVEAKGFKVAFIGVSNVIWKPYWNATKTRPGLAQTYDPTRAVAAIEEARQHADLVVVLVHWGVEYTDKPEPYQVKKGRQFIDAGADLVIGSHPHVLQGFESYKGRWIAYSLGNFVFTGTKSPQSAETGVLTAVCRRNGECALKFHPMLAKAAQPAPMDDEAAQALLARLAAVSTAVRIEENGNLVEHH